MGEVLIFFQARSAKVHVRKDGVLLFYIAASDGKVHVRKDGVLILFHCQRQWYEQDEKNL